MDPSSPLSDPFPTNPRPRWPRWILVGACVLFLTGIGILSRRPPPTSTEADSEQVDPAAAAVRPEPPSPSGQLHTSPIRQTRWREVNDPAVYMPTGSGRVASAGFGSVRTSSSGASRFHEGVDISPTARDRRQRALDDVFSVSDGTVAYINRSAGNSSYGIYVVIAHDDPVGEVYSLYAHLASVPGSLKTGKAVTRGQVIGRMGHSSTLGIPVSRSHLHLELCLQLNQHYSRYSRAHKRSNPHGNFHGFNLSGFDPRVLLFSLADTDPAYFSFLEAIQKEPVAWRVLLQGSRRPDFFDRHPSLWNDSPASGTAFWVEVSHGGLPLSGGFATPEEAKSLRGGRHRILDVDEAVLGRNGRRHVQRRDGTWVLGSNGESWKDILLYRP